MSKASPVCFRNPTLIIAVYADGHGSNSTMPSTGTVLTIEIVFLIIVSRLLNVTPNGDIGLVQHWPRQWLVAWQHQTNADISSKCPVVFRAVAGREIFTFLKLLPHLPEANEIMILTHFHGPLTRYGKLRVARAPGMPETFSPPPRVGNPDMHHGTCRDANWDP